LQERVAKLTRTNAALVIAIQKKQQEINSHIKSRMEERNMWTKIVKEKSSGIGKKKEQRIESSDKQSLDMEKLKYELKQSKTVNGLKLQFSLTEKERLEKTIQELKAERKELTSKIERNHDTMRKQIDIEVQRAKEYFKKELDLYKENFAIKEENYKLRLEQMKASK